MALNNTAAGVEEGQGRWEEDDVHLEERLDALIELRRRLDLAPISEAVVAALRRRAVEAKANAADSDTATQKAHLDKESAAVACALRSPPQIDKHGDADQTLLGKARGIQGIDFIHGCECPEENARMTPFDVEDSYHLARFLRARSYDVDKTEVMLRKCLQWRKADNVNGCLRRSDPVETLWQCLAPADHCGHDRLGRPVVIQRTGVVRPNKILKHLEREDFMIRHSRLMELVSTTIMRARERFGPHVTQHLVIMDLKDLSFRPHPASIPLFRQTIEMDQSYYPETLGALFLINAPMVFTSLWPILKPFIDPKTRAKFHVLGSNYKDTLLRFIDASQFPKEYGGTASIEIPQQQPLPAGWTAPPIEERRHPPCKSDEEGGRGERGAQQGAHDAEEEEACQRPGNRNVEGDQASAESAAAAATTASSSQTVSKAARHEPSRHSQPHKALNGRSSALDVGNKDDDDCDDCDDDDDGRDDGRDGGKDIVHAEDQRRQWQPQQQQQRQGTCTVWRLEVLLQHAATTTIVTHKRTAV